MPQQISNASIYCGDMMKIVPQHVLSSSIDIIVTSPPYNIGTSYGTYNDKARRNDFLGWCDQWLLVLKQVLKKKGSFFLNIGSKPSSPHLPFELMPVLLKHFKVQNIIHWVKSIVIDAQYNKGTVVNVGHYKPINSPRYLADTHEYVFHLTKTGSVDIDKNAIGVAYKDESNGTRWKSGGNNLRDRGNVWYIPYSTSQLSAEEKEHPASFPVGLVRNCIKLHGKTEGMVLLDPFMGTGNSCIACEEEKVKFIGVDIDENYVHCSLKKIIEYVKTKENKE